MWFSGVLRFFQRSLPSPGGSARCASGLAILFFAAAGAGGKDLFDPSLPARTGEYDQYHHGEMDAYHISYFRRMWEEERAFHTCNLRKSYGFHLVAQGADPLPDTADMTADYRMLVVKRGLL